MRKLIVIMFVLLCGLTTYSQRDALYYQYLFNPQVLNPAFTGSEEKLIAKMVNRNQWVGIKGAPHTFTLSGHMPTKKDKLAIGAYIYTDHLGPLTNFGVISTYAWRLKTRKGKLSLGLQFGFKQRIIDWDLLYMDNMNDMILLTRPPQKMLPDANFGVFYNTDKFFISFSSKHLFDRVFEEWGYIYSDQFTEFARHFYTYFGGFIKMNRRWEFKPSAMLKYVDNGDLFFDLNAQFQYKNLVVFGTSYRSNYKSFVFLGEFQLNSRLRFGYSFDTYLGDIKAHNCGTHEIVITYELEVLKRVTYDACRWF